MENSTLAHWVAGIPILITKTLWKLPDGPDSTKYYLIEFWFGEAVGSSHQEDIIQVFSLKDKKLVLQQEIIADMHGPFLHSARFDSMSTVLTMNSIRYADGEGHCCASLVDIVSFKWDGRKFKFWKFSTVNPKQDKK